MKYLASAAENLAVATLERRLAAINQAHVEISAPSPTKNVRVKQVMAGIRRVKGTKQRRVQALVKDDLLRALVMLEQQTNGMKVLRDRALLLVGFAGGIADGPAFRSVDRHGNVGDKLSAHAVALIVKESVGRAGGNIAATSAHSLRAGYVSTAVDTLLPHQIMEVTGHRSMTTLSKYIRPVMRRKIPSLL